MAEPSSSLLSVNAASGAYRASRDMESAPAVAAPAEADKPSFSDMLADAGRDAVQTVRQAEAVAQTGLQGNADTQAVVEATLELDSTVKVAVSVRDKLVEAYQEIIRMPV
ncbi:flagellar hook-basal body complex protein FliE [Salipiger sp. P9]|uniref:flagellar hook-basal body complex protein FliE n=1 Tax=Salipiger pentaromativorans TaxID=2943193 RepID=UPI002157A640|nr:flagellar hook-basal body complex protein FliE [Salipiger pentaromativorans]MCR8550561.1 flagellar hook-basal body complex protein FliE [Salipiger pentaromativorans]